MGEEGGGRGGGAYFSDDLRSYIILSFSRTESFLPFIIEAIIITSPCISLCSVLTAVFFSHMSATVSAVLLLLSMAMAFENNLSLVSEDGHLNNELVSAIRLSCPQSVLRSWSEELPVCHLLLLELGEGKAGHFVRN